MVVYTLDGDQQSGYDVRRQKEFWGTLDEWSSLLYPKADYTRQSLRQKLTEKYGQGTYAAFSDDDQFGV